MAAARVSVLLQCAATDSRRPATFPFCSHTHSRLIVLPDWKQSFHINKRSFNVRSQSRNTPLPSSCPSVCPHVSALLLVDGFSKIWCWETLWLCQETPYLVTNGQKLVSCCMDNYVRFMVAGNASSLLPHRRTTTPSSSLLLPVTVEQHTMKLVFCVHIATVLTRSHHKLPLILLSSLTM